jgi:class 3 adenylate cyclase/streptogramin lyase
MPRNQETPQRLLTTVLFTDIVSSTARAAELGDKRWRRLLTAHHALVRRELKRFNGREIDTAGDGFFATFDQPSQAIRCARALAGGVRRLGIETRAGIHMGEVETIGPKVGGLTVHIGARVMSEARPGEVLVSSTVRDLLAGSDIGFGDRGVHELKGVPAQWRLFSVDEQDTEPEEADADAEQARGRRVPLLPLSLGAAAVVAVAVVATFLVSRGGSAGPLVSPRSNTVVRIDATAGTVLGAVPVGLTPMPLAAGSGGVWVANSDDATLQRIDPGANTASPARALPAANTPTGLAVGGGFVWITAGYSDTMYKVDPAQAHLDTPITVGFGAAGVAYGHGAVWVTNRNTDDLLRLDPQTGTIRRVHLDAGSAPLGVAVGAGSVWVAESLAGKVLRIDPSTMKITRIPLPGGQPSQIAVGDGSVWVSIPQDDSVFRIDPSTNRGTTIPNVGNGPTGIAAGEGRVWIANAVGGTVTEIDARAGRVVRMIHLGLSPDGVAVTPGAVWVTLHAR